MKTPIKSSLTFVALGLIGLSAKAVEVSVNADLRATTKLTWHKVDKFRHSGDCYPMGKSSRNTDLGSETIESSLFLPNLSLMNQTSTAGTANVNSARRAVNLGRLSLELSQRRDDEATETFSIQLNDQTSFNNYRNIGDSNCVIHEYHWNTGSNRIEGAYTVRIKMPSDSRLLRIRLSSAGQAAQIAGVKLNDFKGNVINPGADTYVWGEPDSYIEVPVKVGVFSGGGVQGRIDLRITQPGLKASQEPLAALQSSLTAFKAQASGRVEAFINAGAAIVGHPDVARKVVAQLGIDPMRELNDSLFRIANASMQSNADEMNVKAMAAALGYELALALLDDLKAFCATKDVYLPLLNQTVQRQGLFLAYFWISQSVHQVQELKFPDIEAYLGELTRWENNGLRYSDIANDKVAQKNLTDAYVKLRQFTRLAFPVYGSLKATLKKVESTFGTIGSDPEAMKAIYALIDSLAVQQSNIQKQVQTVSFKFTTSNNDPVAAASILRDLKNFEVETETLSQAMANSMKFYSLKTDGTSNTVLDIMTESLANQVGIFEKPLQSPFIEKIRMSFARSTRVTEVTASYRQCLGVK